MTRARKPKAPAVAASILVVDDSPDTLELIERNLAAQGYRVRTASRADQAMDLLATQPVDLLVTDIRMPGRSGFDLIGDVRERHPGIEIIVITGYATIDGAVRALQAGAWNYLAKPFTDEELFHAVRQVLGRRGAGAAPTESAVDFHGLLGRSSAMRSLAESLSAAAPGDAPVLLRGEMGSGRESAARALHALASRPGTFQRVSLDVRSLADAGEAAATLAVAEQAAAGGTLYLAALDAARDAVRRAVGERLAAPRAGRARAHVRFVLSASAGPEELARLGRVGADIVRRVPGVVSVPPLRERGDDVLLLARHFLAATASEARVAPRALGEAASQALLAWVWPGNVSELRDLCVLLALSGRHGVVGLGELPATIAGAMGQAGAGEQSLGAAERAHIARVLQRTGGNKSRAAEILGIDRKTLRDKLRSDEPAPGGD